MATTCGAALGKQSGSALITVLIAAGIGAAIMLATGQMIIDMQKGQNGLRARSEIDTFHEELRVQLSDRLSCYNTFAPLGAYTGGASFNVNNIMNNEPASPTVKFTAGGKYGSDTLQIVRMTLDYADNPTPPLTGEGTLRVLYRPTMEVLGPSSLKERTIILSIKKNAANALVECVAKARMTDGIWQRTAANPADIYYADGKVGVGTSAPQHSLHVVGGMTYLAPGNAGPNPALFVDVSSYAPGGSGVLISGRAGWNGTGLTVRNGLSYFAPSSTGPSQGIIVDTANLDSGSNGILITAPWGWSGNSISYNYGGTQYWAIRHTGQPSFTLGNGTLDYYVCSSGGINGILYYAGSCAASDERLKKNIHNMSDALTLVNKLRPVEFEWKSPEKPKGVHLGFIAQDVEKIFPDVVTTGETDGMKAIKYEILVAPVVKALQEVAAENQKLKSQLGAMEDELKHQRADNTVIRAYLCSKDPKSNICRAK